MGTSNTVSTEACILVGGKYSPTTATAAFTTFGCTARIQMDGGRSTQMSYWNGSSIVSPVRGYLGFNDRLVPHAILIWR